MKTTRQSGTGFCSGRLSRRLSVCAALSVALGAVEVRAITMIVGDTITQTYHISAGSVGPDFISPLPQFLQAVDGRINSITVVPEFTVVGTGAAVPQPFDISINFIPNAANPPQWKTVYGSGHPVTVFNFSDLPELGVVSSTVGVTFGSDWGNSTALNSLEYYHQQSGFPDQTFELGLTITSLDYTPDSVPEVCGTACLLALGLLGVFGMQAKFRFRDNHGSHTRIAETR